MKLLSSLRRRRNRSSLEGGGGGLTGDGEAEADAVEDAEEERRRERERRMQRPPDDDVCPICFGNFVIPCRGPCGHWYCGGCILTYWNYGSALQPCKCPMCFQKITRLIPDASLDGREDGDIQEMIKKYNYLFVGGMHGVFWRVVQLPLIVKRFLISAMDPDGDFNIYYQMRCMGFLLGLLYCSFPWDFLPRGRPLTTPRMFELFAMLLFLVLRLFGYIWRWHRRQRRQLLG